MVATTTSLTVRLRNGPLTTRVVPCIPTAHALLKTENIGPEIALIAYPLHVLFKTIVSQVVCVTICYNECVSINK